MPSGIYKRTIDNTKRWDKSLELKKLNDNKENIINLWKNDNKSLSEIVFITKVKYRLVLNLLKELKLHYHRMPEKHGIEWRKRIKGKTIIELYGEDGAKHKLDTFRTTIYNKLKNSNYAPQNNWSKHNIGHFFSVKNNKNLYYRSSYELLAYQILETLITVKLYKVEFVRIPYIFNNKKHIYIVDLYVEYTNGEKQLIEVKAKWFLTRDRELNQVKLEIGKKYAELNNMSFSVWTEDSLFRIGLVNS